jgi:hypothetical protein
MGSFQNPFIRHLWRKAWQLKKGLCEQAFFVLRLLARRWAEIPHKRDLPNVGVTEVFGVKAKNGFAD